MNKIKILLADDHEIVREGIRKVLETDPALEIVAEARNGREALAILEQPGHGVNLVLTDVIMPDMGGVELADRVAGAHPDVRIVYMSGYSEHDKLHPGVRSSPYPFLQKPFSPENLAARIREALDHAPR